MKVLSTTEIFFYLIIEEFHLAKLTPIENLIKIDMELFSVKDMLLIL